MTVAFGTKPTEGRNLDGVRQNVTPCDAERDAAGVQEKLRFSPICAPSDWRFLTNLSIEMEFKKHGPGKIDLYGNRQPPAPILYKTS